MIRIGVFGAEICGRMHVCAYAQNPLVELVGICDLDEGPMDGSLDAESQIPCVTPGAYPAARMAELRN